MKSFVKGLALAVACAVASAAWAGKSSIGFKFEADHTDCLYKLGEEAVVTVTATNGAGETLAMRERLAAHRSDPACSGCHAVMDPLGFALENFDAIGTWRTEDRDAGEAIDASGELADGTVVVGPVGLRAALLENPEQIAQTLTEKLLIYALGRSLSHNDMPAVRKIVREAARNDYRFSAILTGIVGSRARWRTIRPTRRRSKNTAGFWPRTANGQATRFSEKLPRVRRGTTRMPRDTAR